MNEPGGLCLDCAMCCNGTVFSHLATTVEDRDRLGRSAVGHASRLERLEQPCRFLAGKCCTIYRARPSVCSAYRCKTLTQATAGQIGFEEAKERLRKVTALHQAFLAEIPQGMSVKDAIDLATHAQSPDWQPPDNFLRLMLAFVALQTIIDRHLREDANAAMVRPVMG